ncbi:MAG: dCMP deaminase family protein [Patescibacteria group bacterium]|jgi:dCMP deaminase
MPKREDYISWDECFMQMAHLIAMRSKDPSSQVGAVIVDDQNVIVGMGYNGWPRGIKDDELPWDRSGGFLGSKYAFVVHAEENAVYNANKEVKGCKVYCTLFPCNECAKTLIQNNIKEIVYSSDKYHDEEIWIASRKLLDLAGVKYQKYSPKFKLKLE